MFKAMRWVLAGAVCACAAGCGSDTKPSAPEAAPASSASELTHETKERLAGLSKKILALSELKPGQISEKQRLARMLAEVKLFTTRQDYMMGAAAPEITKKMNALMDEIETAMSSFPK